MPNLPKEVIIVSTRDPINAQNNELQTVPAPKKPKIIKTCPICLKDSIFPLNAKKYCSKECSLKALKLARQKNYSVHRQYNLDYARKQRRLNPTYMREYWKSHKKERRIHGARRRLKIRNMKKLIVMKITRNLRSRTRDALKGIIKSKHTLELLGCSVNQLRKHLESKFKPSMTWENYGVNGWTVDHIRPCASFDLLNPEEQYKCFHYTNLQPLWAIENSIKGDNYDHF
jgi:hypothetical protein